MSLREFECGWCQGTGFAGAETVCTHCEGYGLLRAGEQNRCPRHVAYTARSEGCPLCRMKRRETPVSERLTRLATPPTPNRDT